jgi:hypothetical protein
MPQMIRGLTLLHPWPLAFLHLGKDVENRTWDPRTKGGRTGMTIALHGGVPPVLGNNRKYRDFEEDWAWLLDGPRNKERVSQERLTWISEQCTVIKDNIRSLPEGWHFRPGIVAVATLADVTQYSTSPWAARGQFNLLLTDVTPLKEPVTDEGFHQGLWSLQPDALKAVESQLGRSFS